MAGNYRRRIYLPECGSVYELNYRTKRKQLPQTLPWSLKSPDVLDDGSEKLLWNYVRKHYPEKELTSEQLFFIWSGKQASDTCLSPAQAEQLETLAGRLLKSAYFSPNPRRLFLFHANNEDEVEKLLAPKEITPQQLETSIQRLFSGFPYKKISFHRERRKVLLNFDFPDSVDMASFEGCAAAFCEETQWEIAVAPSMNHAAASRLLAQLFLQRVGKTSYFVEQKAYAIQLTQKEDGDSERCTRFRETTGWQLQINEAGAVPLVPKDQEPAMFLPEPSGTEPMEQNMVQYCVDRTFEMETHQVYKKSVKSDAQGNYLELSFLSPEVGKRYSELLAQLASQTQWRIRIADSVNQKEIFEIIRTLCGKYEIPLLKNPSYLPQERMIQIQTTFLPSRNLQERLVQEVREVTGLPCMVSISPG